MKQMLIKFIMALVAVAVAPFSLSAYDFVYEQMLYSYMSDKSKVTLVGSTGRGIPVTDLVIPSKIQIGNTTVTVAAIAPGAFTGDGDLVSVSVPGTVTSIGQSTFYNCTKLERVSLAAGLNEIGANAFNSCSSLKKVVVPSTVTTLGIGAFRNCTSLRTVTLSCAIRKIDILAFGGCSALDAISIPETVDTIRGNAFQNCTRLFAVRIPKSVSVIVETAFSGCDSIMNVEVSWPEPPSGFADLFSSQVYRDGILFVPDGTAESYGKVEPWSKFQRKASAACVGDLYYSLNAADRTATLISCASGKSAIQVPPTVRVAGTDYTVVAVGDHAFQSCARLDSVELPNTVTKMGEYVFQFCRNLTVAKLPTMLTEIGERVFNQCERLKSVVMPDYAESIGVLAFCDCSSLTSITIPRGVKRIFDRAFYCCRGLKTVTFPESLESISQAAFAGCGLTSVSLPDSVTTLSRYSFQYCDSLTELRLGTGLTSINEAAFYQCTAIGSVTVGWLGVPPAFGNIFKAKVYENATLRVPTGTTDLYKQVEPWSKFLKIEEYGHTGIGVVEVSEADAPCDVYSIAGVKVASSQRLSGLGNAGLDAGIYVLRLANGTSRKIIIR